MKKREKHAEMTFLEHTRELRNRLIKSLVAIFAVFCVLLALFPSFIVLLSRPLTQIGASLYAFRIQEGIVVAMEASFWGAFVFTSPYWLFQLAAFFFPALSSRTKRSFILWICGGFLLVLGGFIFSYLVMIPVSLTFLMKFSTSLFKTLISAENYVRFFLSLFILSGIIFQTPLVMLFLSKIGILDVKKIGKHRNIVIVVILIVAAIITPPDVVSQIIFFVPMYLLFELGVLLCRIASRSPPREEE